MNLMIVDDLLGFFLDVSSCFFAPEDFLIRSGWQMMFLDPQR